MSGNTISVLFDTNVYDLLSRQKPVREQVARLCAAGALEVVVTRTVLEELLSSQFAGVPPFFPYRYVGNTVGSVDMAVDDSIGDGEIFEKHLGASRQVADALVVDAAFWHAQWLVSEDRRLVQRASTLNFSTQAMTFDDFTKRLHALGASFERE